MTYDPYNISLHPGQAKFFSQVLNSVSGEFINNPYNEFADFGGFGSGKSFLNQLLTMMILSKYSNSSWLYLRKTYPELNDSVIPQIKKSFPEDIWGYTPKTQAREFHFNNGSKIYFRSFDMPQKILSNAYTGASICQAEEIPWDIYMMVWGRMRDRVSGIPKNVMLLEGNPSEGWCKERYKTQTIGPYLSEEDIKHIYFQETTTFQNTYLPKDYIDSMLRKFPKAWVRRYMYGEWGNFDEMVFPEFTENFHIIEPIDPRIPESMKYKRIMGGDYGYRNPSALLWAYKDYDGNIIIYNEYYEKEKTIEEISLQALKYGKIPVAFDFSTKRPDRDGKSVWTELSKMGVPLIESNKDEMRNIVGVNTLFKNRKLFITRDCVNLIKEIRNYKWKKLRLGLDANLPEETVDKDNHAIDAMLYLCAYIEDWRSIDPKKMRPEQQLSYHTQQRQSQTYKLEDIA